MRNIECYSYHCGVIDCLNEMVCTGVKALAFSPLTDSKETRDELIAPAEESCRRFSTRLYIEDAPLLTDLFPVERYRHAHLILFYREDHILEQYLRLKERKNTMVAGGAYFGGNRNQIAWELGRLMSYTDEAVRRLILENTDKEQV